MVADRQLGRVLDGRYEITKLIGRGGMGAVYEAMHRGLAKRVAIKMLLASSAGHQEAHARFLREGRAASKLNHPHIVEVTDFGHTEEGEPFLVMELLEGEDLHQTLARESRLSLERAAPIFQKVFSAIQVAHEGGIIHRDLKPQNLFLCRYSNLRDFPKVLDFGISKILDAATTLTTPDSQIGTPEYMAPEQAKGLSLAADRRTDVFALGAILYRTLTGEAPFSGSSPVAVFYNVVHSDPRPLRELCPGVPVAVAELVDRALAKEPADRFDSVAALSAAFCGAVGLRDEAASIAAASPPPEVAAVATRIDNNQLAFESTLGSASGEKLEASPRAAPVAGRSRTWLALGGTLVVLGGLGALALLTRSEPDRGRGAAPDARPLEARVLDARAESAPDAAARPDLARPLKRPTLAGTRANDRKTKAPPRKAPPRKTPSKRPPGERDVDY